MGTLTPGATYIYERVGGTVYSREFGKLERTVIGQYPDPFSENLTLDYELETVWKDIIKESRTNPTLQEAVNRVKILYHLSKDHGKE
jgi:hypothetical protein